jgi:hypothetical protein
MTLNPKAMNSENKELKKSNNKAKNTKLTLPDNNINFLLSICLLKIIKKCRVQLMKK